MSSAIGNRLTATMAREIYGAKKQEFFRTLWMIRSEYDLLIKEAATRGMNRIFFEVPKSYLGCDPYDRVEMGKELVEDLTRDGYVLEGTYIRFSCSWGEPSLTATKRRAPLINVERIVRGGPRRR